MERPQVRDRSRLNASFKKIELISIEEIEEAIAVTVNDSFSMDADEALQAASRLLGFKRLTEQTRTKFEEALEAMKGSERITHRGTRLGLAN